MRDEGDASRTAPDAEQAGAWREIRWEPAHAEAILRRWLDRKVCCESLRPLTGGCVYAVLEARFDGPESPVVLKIAGCPGVKGIEKEAGTLRYLREKTTFPVPAIYGCDVSGDLLPGSYLIMERLPGENLGEAASSLPPSHRRRLEEELGRAVAALHSHTGPGLGQGYGFLIGGDRAKTWADWFGACLREEWEDNVALGLVRPGSLAYVERFIGALPHLLDFPSPPRLVHGDIWATNIMVDPSRESSALTGFLDPGGILADPEYELAYIDVWDSFGEPFFNAYHEIHPRREGYDLRRSAYWLHTLLLHVRFFREPHYVARSEAIIADLSRRYPL